MRRLGTDYAKVGYSATVGNYAKVGDYAKITKTSKEFTKEYILQHLGVVPDQKNYYTLYKCVKPNLVSFYDSTFKYTVKGRWKNEKFKKNQSIECGEGCHFTTYWKAVGFAQKREHKIISARIHINDILAVHEKVRVRAFSNVNIIEMDL